MSPVPDAVSEKPIIDFDSCLQCGDCTAVCPTNAIQMEGEGVVIYDDDCTNCDLCVDACPDGLIATSEGEKPDQDLVIKEECIGCSICEQACPVDAIDMDPEQLDQGRGLAIIDSATCILCDTCSEVCPTDCITLPQQFRDGYGDESRLGDPLLETPEREKAASG